MKKFIACLLIFTSIVCYGQTYETNGLYWINGETSESNFVDGTTTIKIHRNRSYVKSGKEIDKKFKWDYHVVEENKTTYVKGHHYLIVKTLKSGMYNITYSDGSMTFATGKAKIID